MLFLARNGARRGTNFCGGRSKPPGEGLDEEIGFGLRGAFVVPSPFLLERKGGMVQRRAASLRSAARSCSLEESLLRTRCEVLSGPLAASSWAGRGAARGGGGVKMGPREFAKKIPGDPQGDSPATSRELSRGFPKSCANISLGFSGKYFLERFLVNSF